MFKLLGPDTGFDAIDDQPISVSMNRFFSRLDQEGLLAKTIVYNLNPRDTELMVANAYNFNDGSVPGKMQYGAAWWFLDQRYGRSIKCAFQPRAFKPFRRYADRFP